MSSVDSQTENIVHSKAMGVTSTSSENNEPRTPTNVRRVRYEDLSVMTSLRNSRSKTSEIYRATRSAEKPRSLPLAVRNLLIDFNECEESGVRSTDKMSASTTSTSN